MVAGNSGGLGAGPIHDRDAADTVLRAALDHAIAVGNVYQHVTLAVEEANDLQRLEKKTAPFVENPLPVPELGGDLYRADLATGNAGIAGILCNTKPALQPTRLCPADVAGDPFDLRVVKAIDDDLVIRPEHAKPGADRAGSATFRAAEYP